MRLLIDNITTKYKRGAVIALVSLFATTSTWAQTDLKIGTTPGSISPSAVFEAASTTKGLLMPRMTTVQMNAVSSPANGLQIYNTTDGCIYIYRVSAWLSTCSPTYAMAWGLLGNAGTSNATNFIGTTDNVPLSIRVNNLKTLTFGTDTSFYRGSTGNTRGTNAVDLQSARTGVSQVASGGYAVLGGGRENTVNGTHAVVSGGYQNSAAGNQSAIGGGYFNVVTNDYSTIGGGFTNNVSEIGRAHV